MSMLSPWLQAVVKAVFCRFWISMASKDRSQAKGAWDKMWEQIPRVGEKDGTEHGEKMKGVAAPGGRKEGKPPAARLLPAKRGRVKGGSGVR